MLLETELDEAILQLDQTLFSDIELTSKAQQIWMQYFNPPRSRTEERIDAGCPKQQQATNSEVAWKKKRNQDICEGMQGKPDASLDEVQGMARDLSSHLLSENILAEQSFQANKQHVNKMVAYLDGCLLESEVDGEFVEVAEAFKDQQERADQQKMADKKRKHNLLNPAKMCDPMTRKVFVAQPGVLDDLTRAELVGCQVADAEHSDFIVETDPANPEDIARKPY